MPSELAKRISALIVAGRKKKGWKQADLAREAGVSRQVVFSWEKGSIPKPDMAKKLESLLGLPPGSISPDPRQTNVAILADEALSKRRVPLIDWVDAGRGAEVVSSQVLAQAKEFVEPSFPVKDNAFALRIQGDSMEPEFHQGDIIIIDPNLEPVAGDCVVVELLAKGGGPSEVTFKEYHPRMHMHNSMNGVLVYDLLPLNPEYQTITVNKNNPGRIIGTMTEHHKVRRPRGRR